MHFAGFLMQGEDGTNNMGLATMQLIDFMCGSNCTAPQSHDAMQQRVRGLKGGVRGTSGLINRSLSVSINQYLRRLRASTTQIHA